VWLDIIMEIAILAGVYVIYSFSRGGLATKASIACSHALDIIDIEKAIGIYVEPDIHSFFLDSSVGPDIANSFYTAFYYPPLVLFAIWAYWRHRPKYKILRTTFVISAALAFIVFALYPVAPPRFFDGDPEAIRCGLDLGYVDTLSAYWGVNDDTARQFYNPYAAMPSLHQGWTLMVGLGIIWMNRSWLGKIIGGTIPIAMFIGIVATANHFILDAVGGIIILTIAFGLTRLLLEKLGQYHPEGKPISEPTSAINGSQAL